MMKNKTALTSYSPLALFIFVATLTLGLNSHARAAEGGHDGANSDAPYNRFSLQASAEGEVSNDLLKAELYVEDEDRDASSLANRINAKMAWALEQLKRYPTIKVESGNYNTWAQHDRKGDKIIGWRSSQSINIESEDFAVARKAIGTLQERLQIRGLQMAAKHSTKQAREDQLITEALNAFKHRASIVRDNMGEPGYRIVHIDINTQSHARPNRGIAMRSVEMASMSKMAEPAIAAGTSNVTVHVSGTIELK